jgi:quercetin dioxygenase-like cupin family protein
MRTGALAQVRHREDHVVVDLGTAVIIDQLGSLELAPPAESAAAVYDRPIGLRLLHQDATSGEEHYLVRYPPGLRGLPHAHTSAHTIVVLEGRLEANGRVIGPRAYAYFPAGVPMRHQAGSDEGCLFVILFHGPFDVRVVSDDLPDHGYSAGSDPPAAHATR